LIFRAWSHWRALSGSKHIEFLLDQKLISPKPSKILDEVYSSKTNPFDSKNITKDIKEGTVDLEETLVLHKSDAKRLNEALRIPQLEMEIERAVWQVDKAIQAKKDAIVREAGKGATQSNAEHGLAGTKPEENNRKDI
jgi:hypothetical protein